MQDPQNRALLDYNGTGGTILDWYAFGQGPNDALAQMNGAGTTRATYIPDIQGSIIASLDAASGTLTKSGYQPYGESATTSGALRYTGARIDAETNGLYDFRARMYSPLLGRFLQADPAGTQGGVNLYAYVGNDPLNYTDPSGLTPDAPLSTVGTGDAPTAPSPVAIASAAGGMGGGGGSQAPPVAAAAGGAGGGGGDDGGDGGNGDNGGNGKGSKAPPSGLPTIAFSTTQTPGIAGNIEAALAEGHPSVLTRLEGRDAIRAQRADALAGQARPPSGYSLDEFPFASSQQGGAGARVVQVPVMEQNIQGGMLSSFYQKYGIIHGDLFKVIVVP